MTRAALCLAFIGSLWAGIIVGDTVKDKPAPAKDVLVVHGGEGATQSGVWLTYNLKTPCLAPLRQWRGVLECPSPGIVRVSVQPAPAVPAAGATPQLYLEINREDGTVRRCLGDLVWADRCNEAP